MALRGGRYLFDRRFANRGNDGSMFVSRACGEDRRLVRRTADRGNDKVDSATRDLKEIRRLCQRVRDLEEIRRLRQRVRDLEEIRRLRQRVRDLEVQREMRVKETELGSIVWDDVNEEEEHPFCHPHSWFFEPIYQESFTGDEPDSTTILWDESDCEEDDAVDNEDNLLMREMIEFKKISTGMFDDFLNDDEVAHNGTTEAVAMATGNPTVVIGGVTNSEGTQSQSKVIPCFMSKNKLELHVDPTFTGFPNGDGLILFPLLTDFQKGIDNILGENILVFRDEDQQLADYNDNNPKLPNTEASQKDGNIDSSRAMHEKVEKLIGGKIILFELVENCDHMHDLDCKNTRGHQICILGSLNGPDNLIRGKEINTHIWSIDSSGGLGHFFGLDKIQVGSISRGDSQHKVHVGAEILEWFNLIMKRRTIALFDPGGIGLALGEMTHKAKLFRWVVMIIKNGNRVDVPFDPGGFDPKAKLEDEFFSKTGRMMQ